MSTERECPGWLSGWIDVSVKRSGTIIIVSLALLLLGGFFASQIGLRTDLVELLPTDAPSVVNLETMKKRVATYSNLAIAIESPDLAASQKFADDIAAEVARFPKEEVLAVDHNISDVKDFFTRYKYLFADLADLRDVHDKIALRIREETESAVFESLDEPAPRTELDFDALREKYEKKIRQQDKYPGGYYTTPDKGLIAVFVYPPSSAGSYEDNVKLVDDVQDVIARLDPSKYHPAMTVGLTGDIKTGLEEREALKADVQFISLLCFGLIFVLLLLYYRSLRMTVVLAAPMVLGLVVTLAVTRFTIGYLNTATAFLASIIAGNGINFMIMLSARFFEEKDNPNLTTLNDKLRVSAWGTLQGTLVAGLGASIAYGSLVFAGFRGFRQFGIIGGIGMVLCWIATFAIGPAIIAAMHKRRPLGRRVSKHSRFAPGALISSLVTRWPRVILVVALVAVAGSIVAIIPWSRDPFEYDFRKMRNVAGYAGGSAALSNKVDTIFDLPQSPTPVVADRAEDVPGMKRAIMGAEGSDKIVGDVKTLQDVLPSDQEEKLKVLADIRTMIDQKLDFLSESDREKVLEYRPACVCGDGCDEPACLKVLGLNDIPDTLARPFQEADGNRGRLLYVYAKKGESLLDGKYLLKFAGFIRGVDYGQGVSAIPVGQPMVFADMIASILKDGFKVTVAALIGVLILMIVAFRSARGVFTVLLSVVVGTIWMLGFAAVTGSKLNFLNFVVIPITLGISLDYGANIFSRYRLEGPGSIGHVISNVGGAVMLCALTTIIGYATLLTSNNLALRSFGLLADAGEVACIIAAEIVMTAAIILLERRRVRPSTATPPTKE